MNGLTDGVNNTTVVVHNPPVYGTHIGSGSYVEVIVSQTRPTFFMNAFGKSTMPVNARAVAQAVPSTDCVITLQASPSGGSGIALSGGSSSLSIPTCGILDNATGSSSISASGGASITAGSISVAGTGVSLNGGSSITATNPSTVTTNMTTVSDPLSSIESAPSKPSSCNADPKISNGGHSTTNISNPTGIVCYNGLTISASTVTLDPGVYYINGSLTVTGQTNLTGTGVTFYITNNGAITVQGGQVVLNLTAPTSAPYDGVVFYQNPSDTQTATFGGGAGGAVNGIFYLPQCRARLDRRQ